jgi:hypothetical protein
VSVFALSSSFAQADAGTDDRRAVSTTRTPVVPDAVRLLQAHGRKAAAAAAKARGRAEARARALAASMPQAVICKVFGRHCRAALTVARCESGFRTDAQNGQYLGLFQMGDWARSTYGHGETALVQAKAAHRLFVDTGHTWQPWSCRP